MKLGTPISIHGANIIVKFGHINFDRFQVASTRRQQIRVDFLAKSPFRIPTRAHRDRRATTHKPTCIAMKLGNRVQLNGRAGRINQ